MFGFFKKNKKDSYINNEDLSPNELFEIGNKYNAGWENAEGSFMQDHNQAFLYYKLAADKGHIAAMSMTGFYYQEGVVGDKNICNDPNLRLTQPIYSSPPLKRAIEMARHNPYNYIRTVMLLINAGANVNSENDTDNPLLLLAAVSGCYTEVLHLLLDAGIDVESGNQGFRALEHMAINNDHEAIYMFFVELSEFQSHATS